MEALTPFRQFVLKVHSRCDLACDHCYVFEHADQSWRGRPLAMSVRTMEHASKRIAEHAARHELTGLTVILHGGEPLLAGPEHLGALIDALRTPLKDIPDLDLRVHTNGVRFDRRFGELFRSHGVKVGISLDGDQASNDRHRRYADGRSSYDKVVTAIDLLRAEFDELYSGLLCTIDVANDPLDVYRELIRHAPPAVDFLLPHATWDTPPVRPSETAYADWLITIFDAWLEDGRPVPVRTFDSIISTSHGRASLTESLGLEPSDLLVIETDGAFEQADSLKTAFDGAPATGMDVFGNSIDEVAANTGIAARQGGLAVLCETCRGCPVVQSCGGGLFAHRYRSGSGFDNPSVFCADLTKLIEHVRGRATHPSFVMDTDALGAIAAGYGGERAIASLDAGQRSLRRALIAAVQGEASNDEAWRLLLRVDETDGEALDTVLAHPYFRVWAVGRLRDESPHDDGHLAAIACVAAARAGVDAALDVPVREGHVGLPTIGRFEARGQATARVEVRGGVITVDGADAVEKVRRLTAGPVTVSLDDVDPFRDCHSWPAAPRLTDEQAALWQLRFQEAWELIEERFPDYAPGLAAGLSTIVPLADPGTGRSVSSAARDAFGSVGIALPQDSATLALLILHEFQHVKLGAVLDLFELFDPDDRRLYHAPWRTDPRPLEGLFQGIYAHIAVTDFWRRRRWAASAEVAAEAARQFAHWHAETTEAVGTLCASGSLSRSGESFARKMRATLASWEDDPAPPARCET